MLSVQAVADWVSRGADLYRYYVPQDAVPYPTLVTFGVAAAGFLLAFWGARLLKTIYILGFMVAGAAVGFRIGSNLRIDTLVGLTFGAGIAAFIGYVLYRWWVGVTAGTVAVLLVLAVAWPRIQDLQQGFDDYRRGVGTADYESVLKKVDLTPVQYVEAFSVYLWTGHRDFASRFACAAGLAWLLGVVLGLALPRFTTVMGTSVLGVTLAAGGVGVLLYRHWPAAWNAVTAHPDWYLMGMAAVLIISSWHQVRPGRAVVVPTAPPAEAPPAPAK